MIGGDPLEEVDLGGLGRGGVERDRWGRAVVVEPDGRTRSYFSASGLADVLSDVTHLHRWRTRLVATGLGRNPELALMCAGQPYADADKLGLTPREKRMAAREIDNVVERAFDRAGGNRSADYGTAGHSFTEPGNPGRPVPEVTHDRLAGPLLAWDDLVKHLPVVATEVCVANQELQTFGTFDHLVDGDVVAGLGPLLGLDLSDCAGKLVVLDKKFGSSVKPHVKTQIAVYATARPYFPEERRWSTFEEEFGRPVSSKWGLVSHMASGVVLYVVDLVAGYAQAELAVRVRLDRREKRVAVHDTLITPGMVADAALVSRLLRANSRQDVVRCMAGVVPSDAVRRVAADLWNGFSDDNEEESQ